MCLAHILSIIGPVRTHMALVQSLLGALCMAKLAWVPSPWGVYRYWQIILLHPSSKTASCLNTPCSSMSCLVISMFALAFILPILRVSRKRIAAHMGASSACWESISMETSDGPIQALTWSQSASQSWICRGERSMDSDNSKRLAMGTVYQHMIHFAQHERHSKNERRCVMAPIEPGKKAPAFALRDQDEKLHKLSEYKGAPVVLFFYPKDMTSGCTREACDFRDLAKDFSKAGAKVLGVSILPPKSKKKFADRESLNYPLLADDRVNEEGKPAPEIAAKYGVWVEKSMYGRKYMGINRTTYLIDAGGKVAKRWDKVSVPDHADEVLAAVKQL